MKTILMTLLMAAAPPCLSMAVACACDKGDCVKKQVYVTADGKKVAKVKAHNVIVRSGDCDKEGPATYTVTIDDEHKDGRSEAKTFFIGEDGKTIRIGEGGSGYVWVGGGPSEDAKKARIIARAKDAKARTKALARAKTKGGGWLGVSIDAVPEVLADQFDLEGQGVIVVNVVGESPADLAGFQAHDVILKVNGDIVSGEIGKAVDLIKTRSPGDEVDILVLRGGEKKPITVKLGSRPDVEADTLEFKFEGAPVAEVEERVRARGKILRKLDGGKWVMEDLGDLKALKHLPKQIEMLMPKVGSRSTQVHLVGEDTKLTTRVERDGETLVITRKGEGPIKVVRVDDDGDETKVLYENEDELKERDEEAYLVWEDVGETAVVHLNLDGIEVPDIEIPDIDFEIPEIHIADIEIPDIDIEIPEIDVEVPELLHEWDDDAWKEHAEEWKAELEVSLGEAQKSYERAMEEYKKAMAEWREGKVEVKEWPDVFFSTPEPGAKPKLLAKRLGKPKHSFEIDTDGSIEVRIRKGDSELVQLYKDADDLARRSPELYKKYRVLMGIERE
jgi:hypothetical protein